MKVLAIALACASCVSTSASPPDPGTKPSAPAPDLGEITVVAAPAAPSSTPRSAAIVRTFDDDDHGSDACHAVALGEDGSFVVAGEVQRLAEGRNAWARRYEASGGVGWTYELHTPSEGADAARGVVSLDDGGAVLAGEWYSGSPTAQNNFVAQLGGDGGVAWLTEGELDGADDYASVARTATGDLVVAGALGSQAWVRGLAGNGGAMQWEVAQGDNETARRAVVADSGDVIAAGASDSGGWVTRYRAQQPVGTLQLAAAVDDVAATCCGTAVVSGGVLAMYDSAGAVLWQTNADEASWRAVTARTDGTLVVAGVVQGDLAVRIYSADGRQLWQGTVAGAVPEAVAANAAGDVVACGSRDGDVLAVKFGR
jgi:hypothetical protein